MLSGNEIILWDMDGTIINSMNAVKNSQLEALERKGVYASREDLDHYGLKALVDKIGLTMDEFFNGPYETPDPFKSAESGDMSIFEDAVEILEKYHGLRMALISNSSQKATMNKIEALKLTKYFDPELVFAEYEEGKAKPSTYMAEQALEILKASKIDLFLNVGDKVSPDMEMGHNLKEQLGYQNLTNLLINREEIKDEESQFGEIVIPTLRDIEKFGG